jgi:hypothetical protein
MAFSNQKKVFMQKRKHNITVLADDGKTQKAYCKMA